MAKRRLIRSAVGVACGLGLSTGAFAHGSRSDGGLTYIQPAAIEEESAAAMDRELSENALSVGRFLGMPVRDMDGDRVGMVRDALLDGNTGKIDYVVIGSDIRGVTTESTVPFDSVLLDRSENAVILNDEREALLNSPSGDEFFGVSPSDEGPSMENRTGQPPDRWHLGSSPEGRNY